MDALRPAATRPRQAASGYPSPGLRGLVRRWGTAAGVSVLAAGAFVTLRHLDPADPDSLLPPCPFLSVTGLYCPGCGSTRCLHALAHFDLGAAFAMNPLLVVSLPLLGILVLGTASIRVKLPGVVERLVADPRFWLWLLVAYWILRNLPWPPFSWLAPGA